MSADINAAWEAKRAARWLQPNPQRFLRPDAHRYVKPERVREDPWAAPSYPVASRDDAAPDDGLALDAATLRDLKALRDACSHLRRELAAYRLHRLLCKAGFNEEQPRWPAGTPGSIGGQWSGGSGSSRTTGGAPGVRVAGPSTPGRHHFVPQSLYKKLPLPRETRKVFEEGRTGLLRSGHGWSTDHDVYNEAVDEALARFIADNGIRIEIMTPDQARRFLGEVVGSRDPRIRGYNMKIFMREFRFLLRFGPRRAE